jgi:hypothetical protein
MLKGHNGHAIFRAFMRKNGHRSRFFMVFSLALCTFADLDTDCLREERVILL